MDQSAKYTHLHNHSHYSILDGAMSVDRILDKAQEDGQDAIALTDHGNMFGTIEFYKKAKARNIKPLVGCELYVAPGDRHEKTDVRSLGIGENSYHLVLLAKNEQGYRNLTKLSSIGYLEGFYYKPRVDMQALREHSEGLVALTACLAGEVPNKILREEEEGAFAKAGELAEIFGKDNFYLELQDHGLKEQKQVNQKMVEFAKKLSLPLVATNDAHYADQSDSYAHDVLLCIQTGALFNQEKRMRFDGDQFYLKSQQQMINLFDEIPQAISNTRKITEMIDLNLTLDVPVLPDYEIPEGFTLASYLEYLAREGLKVRYKRVTKEIEQRLEYELSVINKMNFAGYFLIVQDFIQYAKKTGIPVGPGRGSAAGSLVSYSLGITDLDPLKYNLLFERFLNPDRIEMPDVDIDFCQDRRDEVIHYVQEKYGKDKVSQIIAFGTIKSKNAIKDVGRVLEVPYGETDRLAKMVPGDPIPVSLAKALDMSTDLREYQDRSEESKKHIETSLRIEGLVRQASKHAAGVVISRGPLTDYAPLYVDKDGAVTTQYDKDYLEAVGLVKMDFLGLKNLTVIDKAIRIIHESRDIKLDFDDGSHENLDDPEVYKLLSSGKTNGVFQLEGAGMQELLRKAKPKAFEDIIAILALYRPGPLNSGMVDTYIRRKEGKEKINYDHETLEPILRDTYGVIVYQEQVMFISQAIGGFTMSEADVLRKIMGKKKVDKMPAQKEKFLIGAKEKNFDIKLAEKIFDQCATFAEYGFNKSHSAAYALITYRTAYLKAHYPVEYMAALISADMDNTDKVVKYINEAKDMGIPILPPDVNVSERDFTAREGAVNFGLSAIKNVGSGLVDAIIKTRREKKNFSSIYDFIRHVPIESFNSRSMESLVQAGTFDSLQYPRRSLFEHAEQIIKEGQKYQKDQSVGQNSLFGDSDISKQMDNSLDGVLRSGQEWQEKEKLSREKEVLGFYISGHPLDRYEAEIEKFTNLRMDKLQETADGSIILVAGVISDLKITLSKKNNKKNAFFNLNDRHGRVQVVVFNTYYEGGKERGGREVEPVKGKIFDDAILVVEGLLQREESGLEKILLRRAFSLEEAKFNAIRAVHLKINGKPFEKKNIEDLQKLLLANQGDCPVFLHFYEGKHKRVLKLGEKFCVKPTEGLFRSLSHALNEKDILFTYLAS